MDDNKTLINQRLLSNDNLRENIKTLIPSYFTRNREIIKSILYWGFNMTFQLVASWLFVLMLFGKPENINVKQVVICTCLGLCISLVFALLMPSLTKNKLIYKGFKSFFATKMFLKCVAFLTAASISFMHFLYFSLSPKSMEVS